MSGYIYLLLRGDFIEQHKYVYKIGETQRFPPHKRLWDYPYGSVFLLLLRTQKPLNVEKKIKEALSQRTDLRNAIEYGAEYYEGCISVIIDNIKHVWYQSNPDQVLTPIKITEEHILRLNRIHYIVNYDEEYFQDLYQQTIYFNTTEQCIPTEEIYQTYQWYLKWHPAGFPSNYVIRCGMTSIKPNKKICFHHKS